MGKADNRRTLKVKQRKARRKLKARGKKIGEAVRAARKSGKKDVSAATVASANRAAAMRSPKAAAK